jgi:transposase
MIADAMKAHEAAIVRLAELPGSGVDSAQQIIAEVGPRAEAFPSAAQLASWVGVCPGSEESAGESKSNRSAKGNRALRRLLNQLAHAAVRKRLKGHIKTGQAGSLQNRPTVLLRT